MSSYTALNIVDGQRCYEIRLPIGRMEYALQECEDYRNGDRSYEQAQKSVNNLLIKHMVNELKRTFSIEFLRELPANPLFANTDLENIEGYIISIIYEMNNVVDGKESEYLRTQYPMLMSALQAWDANIFEILNRLIAYIAICKICKM